MRKPWLDDDLAANGRTVRENFTDWFSRSKVATASGRPLMVFHATVHDFDAFDVTKSDLGPHFGTLEQAEYLKSRLDGRGAMHIMPVFLSVQNPLRLKDVGSFHADGIADQLEKKGLLPRGEGKRIVKACDTDWTQRKVYDPMLKDIMIQAGYDGIVYKNGHEGKGDSWIVFHAGQVKSAIGNSGLYLKDNPSMTDSQENMQLMAVIKAREAITKTEDDHFKQDRQHNRGIACHAFSGRSG